MSNESKRNMISISFKKNEIWILEALKEYSCPSATIKDILKKHLKTDKTIEMNNFDTNKPTNSIMDF